MIIPPKPPMPEIWGKANHDSKRESWRQFICLRGPAYDACRTTNFEVKNHAQQKVLDELNALDFVEQFWAGKGLILYGECGTGKDHLLAGMVRWLIGCTYIPAKINGNGTEFDGYRAPKIGWSNGAELFAGMRDSFDDTKSSEYVARFTSPDVLLLSDPVLPSGKPISGFQMETLYRILDQRFCQGRPTWATINVADSGRGYRKNLETLLGTPNADRLIDGARVIACHWASYRKPQKATQ